MSLDALVAVLWQLCNQQDTAAETGSKAEPTGPHWGLGGRSMGGSDREDQDRCTCVLLPELCNHICCKLAEATVIIHKALEALQ